MSDGITRVIKLVFVSVPEPTTTLSGGLAPWRSSKLIFSLDQFFLQQFLSPYLLRFLTWRLRPFEGSDMAQQYLLLPSGENLV